MTKPGTDVGAMPAKVSLKARPIVTAGLANEVEEVNQYADPMYAPTAAGASAARPDELESSCPVVSLAAAEAAVLPPPPRGSFVHPPTTSRPASWLNRAQSRPGVVE
jgi:hypothetical protein